MPEPKRRNISQRSEMIYDIHNFGINIDTREVYLTSPSEEDIINSFIDHRTASNFIKNLRLLNSLSNESILVHMITCGGCWNYGMAIYDAIKNSTSDVTVLAYAHARSMSSIIPQAATWRVIMPNADFLIHNGTLEVGGNYQSVVSEVKWAEQMTDHMVKIYVEKCKNGHFFLQKHMNTDDIEKWLRNKIAGEQEFYCTPRESVNYGLMDAVLGDEEYENIDVLRA